MQEYHEHAELMINGGFGYVCTCSADDFREFRVSMTECPCRDNDVSENLEKWNMMNDEDSNQEMPFLG